MPRKINYALGNLTQGERLVIWRRRKRLTQYDMARHWRVSRSAYLEMEQDARPAPPVHILRTPPSATHAEQAFIARRRLGWTLARANKAMRGVIGHRYAMNAAGTSRVAYAFLEAEGSPIVVDYYRKKGFTFV